VVGIVGYVLAQLDFLARGSAHTLKCTTINMNAVDGMTHVHPDDLGFSGSTELATRN
jgi:hypothetical protein